MILAQAAGHAMEWALIFAPLACYFFYLGLFLNRGPHPIVMSGSRSLLGVFLGLSGFFLLGPPTWIVHGFTAWGESTYWVAYGIYVLILLGIAVYILGRQRAVLVIYNQSPNQFAALLQEVLGRMQIPYNATPGRVAIAESRAVLDIECSFLWNNLTIHWHTLDANLRRNVETELIPAVRQARAEFNPGSSFQILVGVGFGLLSLFGAVAFLLIT